MGHWLAFLLLLGPPADLPTIPVSAHLQAMSVSQALSLISKKAGVELSADDSLKSDIVVIRAQEASLRELGRELGTALDAEWSAAGKGFVLSRSAASQKAEEDRQLKYDTGAFARTQATLRSVDQSFGTWDEQAAQKLARDMLAAQADPNETPIALRHLEAQAPVMRLFTRILASIPPDDLAKIPPWGRVAYTTRPNSQQRPMPADGAQAMLQFSEDQAIWFDAASDMARMNLSAGLATAAPYSSEPGKIYVSVRRDEGTKLHAQMRILGFSGAELSVVEGDIVPSGPENPLPPLPDSNAPVALLPTAVTMSQVLRADLDIRQAGQDAALRPLLQSPETTDPLAGLPAQAIDGATQQVAKNLVAVVPDEAMTLYDTLDPANLSRGAVWSALSDLGFQANLEHGWLLLTPARMAASHEDRLDRALLGQLLRSAPDGPTHIELIEAIADSPGGFVRTPLLLHTLQLWSHSLSEQVASSDWLALRTLGALTPDQQKDLFSGKELKVHECGAAVQACVRQMVDRSLFSDPNTKRSSFAILPLSTLEQSDALPNGITEEATIGGTYLATPIASVPPPPGRAASNDDPRIPVADVLKDLQAGTPLEYGMAYTLDLKVHMWPSLYSGGFVTETYYMGVAKKPEDLPDGYRQAIKPYQKEK